MAIKQYHMAVFAEVDTETNEVLRVDLDPEATAGSGLDHQVYNTETEEWERISYLDDPAAEVADDAIIATVRRGWTPEPRLFVLVVVGDVEPEVQGPFPSVAERNAWVYRYRREQDPAGENGLFSLDIRPDGMPEAFAFAGAFFERAGE